MNNSVKWLRDAIFYEIYPQSFADSNGDGTGDLPGIIGKLDYIKSVGANAIWLNPCFLSPFQDAGYDIADYRKVAPRYGTNADLKRLFKTAHRKGMKVILDLVPGHTSTEHKWFQASAKAAKNKYSNYYIWNNDWIDGSDSMNMVTGMHERNASFAVNFFASQPALNYGFANPNPDCPWQLPVDHPDVLKVGQELRDIMKFWLDAGCDGFRVDMAPSLIKKDPGKVKNIEFWQKIRHWFDEKYPDRILLSEWSYAPWSSAAGFHMDFLLFCGTPAYTTLFRNDPKRDIFSYVSKKVFYEDDGNDYTVTNHNSFFDAEGLGDFSKFAKIYLEHYNKTKDRSYIALPTGNHDMPRLSDYRSTADLKVAFAFILTMPCVPFIYYGDEIGMRSQRNLTSKEGGFTRTQARTPMQWDESNNCGFSTAGPEQLYLPVDPRADRPTVAKQDNAPNSLLNTVRELCRLRQAHPALLADGELEFVYMQPNQPLVSYLRSAGTERILVILNPKATPQPASIKLKFAVTNIEQLAGQKINITVKRKTINAIVPPQSYCICKIIS